MLTGFAVQPTGREIDLSLTVDPSATAVSATLYYITEAMTYSNYNKFGTGSSTNMDQTWQTTELSITNGNVTGSVPESAKGYYIEIRTTVGGVEYVTCSSYVELIIRIGLFSQFTKRDTSEVTLR